jgi:hypothetical protein
MDSKIITERLRGVVAGYFLAATIRMVASLVAGAPTFSSPPHSVHQIILGLLTASSLIAAAGFISYSVFFRKRCALVLAICYGSLVLIGAVVSATVFSKVSTTHGVTSGVQAAVGHLLTLAVIAASFWLIKQDRECGQE